MWSYSCFHPVWLNPVPSSYCEAETGNTTRRSRTKIETSPELAGMITFSSKIASFPPFCYFVQIPAKKIQHKYIPKDGIAGSHANSKAAPSYVVTSNG